jgi:hypothetical protein
MPKAATRCAYIEDDTLETFGVTLDYPHSSALEDSKYPFRELRIQSGGYPLRAVYIFDITREAVIVCGGDKTGDKRFYQTIIAQAERIWEQYLREQGR